MKDIALIFYGNGGELGNFSIFATTLKKELDKKYQKVIVKYINRDFQFFDALSNGNAAEKIAEVHVFAHAIGAGIFIGYHDETIKAERQHVKVYGAKSGSHIEVMVKNTWLSSDQLKKKLGHWPSANLPTRLTPDKGGYVEFLP